MPGEIAGSAAAPEVLVIEDDPALLHSLIVALEAFGITIATARDGLQGLKLFRQIAPKVVITDIIMPEQDGIGVIMTMRRERPDVKVIAMSGGGRVGKSDFLAIAKKLGADAVIAKPFDVDALVALIRAPPAGLAEAASDQDAMRAVALPLAAMDVPYMTAALDRWRDARGRQTLASGTVVFTIPSEQEADPLGLGEAAPYTGLTDLIREPLDFRIRYIGPEIVAAQGTDLTGRRVSELAPHRFIDLVLEAFASVATTREPVLHRVFYRHGSRRLDYLRLLLPLSQAGRVVETIWAVTRIERASGQPNPV